MNRRLTERLMGNSESSQGRLCDSLRYSEILFGIITRHQMLLCSVFCSSTFSIPQSVCSFVPFSVHQHSLSLNQSVPRLLSASSAHPPCPPCPGYLFLNRQFADCSPTTTTSKPGHNDASSHPHSMCFVHGDSPRDQPDRFAPAGPEQSRKIRPPAVNHCRTLSRIWARLDGSRAAPNDHATDISSPPDMSLSLPPGQVK